MRVLRINCARGIEIAVRLLCCANLLNQSVDVGFELGIWLDVQSVSRTLDHLIDVGVVEGITGRSFVLQRLSPERRGGPLEVVDALCLFVLLKGEGDGNSAVNLEAWRAQKTSWKCTEVNGTGFTG